MHMRSYPPHAGVGEMHVIVAVSQSTLTHWIADVHVAPSALPAVHFSVVESQ
jgi:hypothetical protein